MNATQLQLFDAQEFLIQTIEEKLQPVLEYLNSIPDINAGGCGLSALAIYRWCRKNGIEVGDRPFVIISNDLWDVQHNNELIDDEMIDRLEYPHIVTEIDGKLWDSTGNDDEDNDDNFSYWPFRCEPIGEDDIIELLNNASWNPDFKRNKYLPLIESHLDIDLSDVEYY